MLTLVLHTYAFRRIIQPIPNVAHFFFHSDSESTCLAFLVELATVLPLYILPTVLGCYSLAT